VSRQPLENALPPTEMHTYTTGCGPSIAITAKSQRVDPEWRKIIEIFRAIRIRKQRNQPIKPKELEELEACNKATSRSWMHKGLLYHLRYPADEESDEDPVVLPYVPVQQRDSVFRFVHDDSDNGSHQGIDNREGCTWPTRQPGDTGERSPALSTKLKSYLRRVGVM